MFDDEGRLPGTRGVALVYSHGSLRRRFRWPGSAHGSAPGRRFGIGEEKVLTIKIIGGLAALAFGLYLGMAREFDQSLDEIDERLGQKNERKTARKHFTFLGFLQKKSERGSDRRRRAARRSPFKL
jgi:hypothetical protein